MIKNDEVTMHIVSKLDLLYGDVINIVKVRSIIEDVLNNYRIEEQETALAVIDNMYDMIILYIATKKTEGLSNDSINHYGRNLKRFADYMRKDVQIITVMDIRVYLAKFSNTGIANTTLANVTDILRGFFNWLEDEEYIDKSPMRKIKSAKVEKRLRNALTKEEFEILRTGAKTLRQKAILEFLYSTGCRLEEVERMNKSDIDWYRLQIDVIGKGNKERTVYINPTTQVHLKLYLNSRIDISDALFVSHKKPHNRLSGRGIEREVKDIMKQSGLSKNVYPHLIRHTMATHLLNSGMDITVLQKILGHDDPSTTLIYAELDNETVQNQYRKCS